MHIGYDLQMKRNYVGSWFLPFLCDLMVKNHASIFEINSVGPADSIEVGGSVEVM